MYGENEVAAWAGRAAGEGTASAPPSGEEIPAEAEVEDEEGAGEGHAAVLANHAQTLRDMCEIIKADARAAMVDDALDLGDKDAIEDICDMLTTQAEAVEQLAESAKGRQADNEDDEELDADDDDDEEFLED